MGRESLRGRVGEWEKDGAERWGRGGGVRDGRRVRDGGERLGRGMGERDEEEGWEKRMGRKMGQRGEEVDGGGEMRKRDEGRAVADL